MAPGGHRYRNARVGELVLGWEVEYGAISDNYTPDEVDAVEMWVIWADAFVKQWKDRAAAGELTSELEQERAFYELGPDWVPIYWIERNLGDLLPFDRRDGTFGASFLDTYGWPVDEDGARVNRARVPVHDQVWLPEGRTGKCGFVQQALGGWKPSAYQPVVNMRQLAEGAELYWPDTNGLGTAPRGR